MKRYCFLPVAGPILVLTVAAIWGGEQSPTSRDFMRLKLNHSQKILEGLVREDYEAMAKNAQELSLLSVDASWQVLQTSEYTQQSLEFRRAADALTGAAKKQNLEGAALAYMDLTMRCVNCHKYVRTVRVPRPNREK